MASIRTPAPQAVALGRHLATRFAELGPCFCSPAVRAEGTLRTALAEWSAGPQQNGGKPCNSQAQLLQPSTPDRNRRQLPPITVTDSLQELAQGSFEGQLRSECYTPEVMAQIAAGPWTWAAPGGESPQQVEQRMLAYLQDVVLPSLAPGGPPAVVVSHGFAIKCTLRGILDSSPAMTRRIRTDNTSITELGWREASDGLEKGYWEIYSVNDVTHLDLAGVSRGTSS